jgi:hypothetical protein
LTVRDVALNCDEGWILAFTFGNIGTEGLAGKILLRVKLIVDLSASDMSSAAQSSTGRILISQVPQQLIE